MANWIKENVVLTNIGRTLLANAQIGLGKIEITRIVSRENFETVNAPAMMRSYTSEDIPASTIQQEGILLETLVGVANPDPENPAVETSLISVRFSNDDLNDVNKSYNLRQIVVFARLINPENTELGEVPYMVAQCAEIDNSDYIPPRKDNPTSMDYDLYIIHSGVPEITVSLGTSGFVFSDTYNREVTKIWNSINDIKDNEVGQNTDGREFKIWKPIYDRTAESFWRREYTGEIVIGHRTAERFNLYAENEDGTYSDNTAVGQCCHVEGFCNEVLASNSHAEGINNYVSFDSTAVSIGGAYNSIYKGQTGVVNGMLNRVGEDDERVNVAFAVFGTNNILHNSSNTSISGSSNTVSDSSSSVVTGEQNTVVGMRESIIAGTLNTVHADHDTNGGSAIAGLSNELTQLDYSVVVGHHNNINKVSNSLISGNNNTVDTIDNAIITGASNEVTDNSFGSIVSGLELKVTNKSQESICTGYKNILNHSSRTSVTGAENTSNETYNSTVSGNNNTLNNSDNNILSGDGNNLSSSINTVLTGSHNTVSNTPETFVTGVNNTVEYTFQSLIGGSNNVVDYAYRSLIGGSGIKCYGSSSKEITDSVVTGVNNTLRNSSTLKAPNGKSVVAGTENTVSDFADNVLSGSNNNVQNATDSVVTGSRNTVKYITSSNPNATSLGIRCCDVSGYSNDITYFENSVITGSYNTLSDFTPNNVSGEWKLSPRNNVISGEHNTVSGIYSSVVTGYGHTVKNIHDSVIGGRDNIVDGLDTGTNGLTNSVFVMGVKNNIENHLHPQAVFGRNHSVSGNNVLVTGYQNIATGDDCIVGGKFNEEDTDNKYTVIIGGGTSDNDRKNIMTLDRNGNLYVNSVCAKEFKNEDGTENITISRSEFEGLLNRVTALEKHLAEKS